MQHKKPIWWKNILFLISVVLFLLLSRTVSAQGYSFNTSGAVPDSSAILDIISADKGLLIPRVSLISTTDSATIIHPAVSLQVYNTNDSMTGGGKGFWYWNGSRWIQIIGSKGSDSLQLGDALTTPIIIGGTATNDSLVYKTTTGMGATGADHIFKIGTNGGTEAMRILNNGRVGIGTSTPAQKLHLAAGNILIDNNYKIQQKTSIGTFADLVYLDYQNYCYFGITSNNGFVLGPTGGRIFATTVGNGFMTFKTEGVSEAMRIDYNGNLGIGTSSPTSILHTIAYGAKTANYTGNFLKNIATSSTASINKYGVEIQSTGTWSGTNANNVGLYISSVSGGTNNYDAIFNGGGNVGIGTTSPTAKLSVQGNTQIGNIINGTNSDYIALGLYNTTLSNLSQGNGTVLQFYNNSNNYNGTVVGASIKSVSANNQYGWESDLILRTVVNNSYSTQTINDAITIKSYGNVGIGTTTPLSKLDIEGGISIGSSYSGSSVAPMDGAIIEGNLGIGCVTPAYKLHVIGDIASSATIRGVNAYVTGAISACSDIRYKKDILPLSNSLDNVLKLQGVNYFWKTKDFPDKLFTDDEQIGFIAQEIEKIYPEVVVTDTDGYKSVDYSRLTPILVEAIKELNEKNEAQQKVIETLKSELKKEQTENSLFKNTTESELAELKKAMKQLTKQYELESRK